MIGGADLVIAVLAVVGLPRLWREQRVFALWLLLGLAFLLVWPTKWPQYVLMVSAPIALAGALGLARLIEPLRSGAGGLRARWSAPPTG